MAISQKGYRNYSKPDLKIFTRKCQLRKVIKSSPITTAITNQDLNWAMQELEIWDAYVI